MYTSNEQEQREQNAKELQDSAAVRAKNTEALKRAKEVGRAAGESQWRDNLGRQATHALRVAQFAEADAQFALETAREKVTKAQAALAKLVAEGFVDASVATLQRQEADRAKANQVQADTQAKAKQAAADLENWRESLKSRQPITPAAPGSVLPADHERCTCGETVPTSSALHKKRADGSWHVRDIRACIKTGRSAEWLVLNAGVTVAQLDELFIKVDLL